MGLALGVRKKIMKAQLDRWVEASRAEKGEILDAVCAVTGWHRDHARKAIRTVLAERANGGPKSRRQREPVRLYGDEAVVLLIPLLGDSGRADRQAAGPGAARVVGQPDSPRLSRWRGPGSDRPSGRDVTGHDRPAPGRCAHWAGRR